MVVVAVERETETETGRESARARADEVWAGMSASFQPPLLLLQPVARCTQAIQVDIVGVVVGGNGPAVSVGHRRMKGGRE